MVAPSGTVAPSMTTPELIGKVAATHVQPLSRSVAGVQTDIETDAARDLVLTRDCNDRFLGLLRIRGREPAEFR